MLQHWRVFQKALKFSGMFQIIPDRLTFFYDYIKVHSKKRYSVSSSRTFYNIQGCFGEF